MAIARPKSELLKTFSATNPWDAERRATFEIHRHFVVGGLVAAGSWLLGRRFSSRRRRQEQWILAQLGSSSPPKTP